MSPALPPLLILPPLRSVSVRAMAASCVIDMFRVFAPEPPFSESQLEVMVECGLAWSSHRARQYVFKHIIRELSNLSDDKTSHFEVQYEVVIAAQS